MLSDFQTVVDEFFVTQDWSARATLIRTFSDYNPDTSEASVGEERIDIKIIVFDYVSKTETNTLIKTGDKQVYVMPGNTFSFIDPSTDFILMDDEKYRVITCKQYKPNLRETLYYELYVRA